MWYATGAPHSSTSMPIRISFEPFEANREKDGFNLIGVD